LTSKPFAAASFGSVERATAKLSRNPIIAMTSADIVTDVETLENVGVVGAGIPSGCFPTIFNFTPWESRIADIGVYIATTTSALILHICRTTFFQVTSPSLSLSVWGAGLRFLHTFIAIRRKRHDIDTASSFPSVFSRFENTSAIVSQG
jgi:hypothetical protein